MLLECLVKVKGHITEKMSGMKGTREGRGKKRERAKKENVGLPTNEKDDVLVFRSFVYSIDSTKVLWQIEPEPICLNRSGRFKSFAVIEAPEIL